MQISGKPRDLCIQAFRMANNDPNLAFELIMQFGAIGGEGS